VLFGIIKLPFVFIVNFFNIAFESAGIKKENNKNGNKYIEIKY